MSHTPAEIRALAEQCLAEAFRTTDRELKILLLEAASEYDWIAEHGERRDSARMLAR